VAGRRFRRSVAPGNAFAPATVIVGDTGVTLENDGDAATIRFADVVAAIARVGGGLDLVSSDGSMLRVDPADVRRGDEAVTAIRAALPPDVVVPLDPRARRLQDAVAQQFKRTWVVTPALEHAWPVLAWDEELVVLAEASRGVRGGVLIVTDRRVILATKLLGEQVQDWPRATIERASGRDVGLAARLRLHLTSGEEIPIWIGPRGRLARVLDELNGSAAG